MYIQLHNNSRCENNGLIFQNNSSKINVKGKKINDLFVILLNNKCVKCVGEIRTRNQS